MIICCLLLLAFLIGAAPSSLAEAVSDPLALAYHQRPESQVPMDAPLRDESGRSVDLRTLTAGRPSILALGYFHCPSLCGVVRDDLLSAVSRSGLRASHDYALIVISIDPTETSNDAATAKRQDMSRYPVPGATQAWHYLTGAQPDVQAIEQSVGFHARYYDQLKQFLHPTGIVFLTPRGVVSGYLLGVGYKPGDVRLGVTRAEDGGIAKAALPVLLLCFHFDPTTGRYTLAIFKVLQLAGAITALTLGGTIALALRRERRRQ
jgi:protein SCO1/2